MRSSTIEASSASHTQRQSTLVQRPCLADADPDELFTQLVARPRIGVWTANYVLMRLLGHPAVWPEGDVALVAGARKFGIVEGKQHKILARKAMDWAPWRSYAAMHIWRNAS